MRFQEVMEAQESSFDDFMYIAEQIKNDCQPYLNEVENAFGLYRGEQNATLKMKNVRLSDRIPKGMDQNLKERVNQGFIKYFREPFRDSMMCSSDSSHVRIFGNVNYVFPIGDFTFLYSPEIKDLNHWINDAWLRDEDSNETIHALVSDPKSIGYRTTDLNHAIFTGAEVMIRCNSAYLLNVDYVFTNDLDITTDLVSEMRKVMQS